MLPNRCVFVGPQYAGSGSMDRRHIGVRFDVIAVTVTPTDVFIHHVPEAF